MIVRINMDAKEEEIAKEIAQKYLSMPRITIENHTIRAMMEYAEGYHKKRIRSLNVKELEMIIRHYFFKYRFAEYPSRIPQIAQAIHGYVNGMSQSKALINRLKNEKENKNQIDS